MKTTLIIEIDGTKKGFEIKEKPSIRVLNKLLKENNMHHNTEVTRKGNTYYLLHICKNNWPVPLMQTTDFEEISNYVKFYIKRTRG